MLTQDDKKQISNIVVDVIQDVVMPAFETLNNKIDKVSDLVEQMDRKLDIVTGKVFTHDSQLVIHEKRLKKVEQITSSHS